MCNPGYVDDHPVMNDHRHPRLGPRLYTYHCWPVATGCLIRMLSFHWKTADRLIIARVQGMI